ncbi:MAG TPA: hypothetical protein VFV41_05025 [Streptosporangiaceae bacterium]|nr:hypothetical protein [Streptosporangiaceae bacterium]
MGRSKVVSIRSVVVFPAPFGPRKPTISPSGTLMSTPRTASTVWRRLVKLRASPAASIIMAICVIPSAAAPRLRRPGRGAVRVVAGRRSIGARWLTTHPHGACLAGPACGRVPAGRTALQGAARLARPRCGTVPAGRATPRAGGSARIFK